MDTYYISTILSLAIDFILLIYIYRNYKYLSKISITLVEITTLIFAILWTTTEDYTRLYISLIEICVLLYFVFLIVKSKSCVLCKK